MGASALRTAGLLVAILSGLLSCAADESGPQNRVRDTSFDVASVLDTAPADELDVRFVPDRPLFEVGPEVVEAGPEPDAIASSDADADTEPPERARDGNACERAADCRSGRCLSVREGFPAGMCTTLRCEEYDEPCQGRDTVCADHAVYGSLCTVACVDDSDCRDGYICHYDAVEDDDLGACLPIPDGAQESDGSACSRRNDCASLQCQAPPAFPGGHCTTFDCRTAADCHGDPGEVVCVPGLATLPRCARACVEDSDCRDGYICVPGADGGSYCDPDNPVLIPFDSGFFEPQIVCGSAAPGGPTVFEFDMDQTSTRATVLAFARDGARVSALRSVDGDGTVIDFTAPRNERQKALGCYFGHYCSLTVPWTDAHTDQTLAGHVTFSYSTVSEDICFHVVQDSEPGAVVHLNLIFVGLESPLFPEDDRDVGFMLRELRTLYERVGMSVVIEQYIRPSSELRGTYRILRSLAEVDEMRAAIFPEVTTWDEARTVSVYLVDDFVMGNLISLTGGIPGPIGVHGSPTSGVVLSAESLRTPGGPAYVAQLIAHEVAHYLGLAHTSEITGGQDPLSDTPYCHIPSAPTILDCPDIDNMMFPFASAGSRPDITEQQGFMLRTGGLARPAPAE